MHACNAPPPPPLLAYIKQQSLVPKHVHLPRSHRRESHSKPRHYRLCVNSIKHMMKKAKRGVRKNVVRMEERDSTDVDSLVAAVRLMEIEEEIKRRATSSLPHARDLDDAVAMASAAPSFDVKLVPGKRITFVVDTPGVKKRDIKVQVAEGGGLLVVSGDRRPSEEDKEEVYVRRERQVGKFVYNFRLPDYADLEDISAKCEDGALTVTVMMKAPPERRKLRTVELVGVEEAGGECEVKKIVRG